MIEIKTDRKKCLHQRFLNNKYNKQLKKKKGFILLICYILIVVAGMNVKIIQCENKKIVVQLNEHVLQ